jgi:hypothetical protein
MGLIDRAEVVGLHPEDFVDSFTSQDESDVDEAAND